MKLTDVLRGGKQCDEEGVEIIMSRQACCEAADRIEELEKQIVFEKERADYAWKNTKTIDKARAEDQKKLYTALDLLAVAYDNLNDLPISEEWARGWCKKALEVLEKN